MKKGFTMIELVLVITILGILAVSALPSFVNLTGNARLAARDGIIGAVRSGIAIKHASDLAGDPSADYPTKLDTTDALDANCSTKGDCFNSILNQPVDDALWDKTADGAYSYTGKGAKANCTYTAAKLGTFTCVAVAD